MTESAQIEARGQTLGEVLSRRKNVAIVTFVVLAIAAFALVIWHGVRYGAIAHVLLVNDQAGRDPTSAGVDMPTIATGSTVLDEVRAKLKLSDSVNDLRRAVDARVSPKSSLMTISAEDRDANLAMKIDNALAASFSDLYWKLARSRYDQVTSRLQSNVNAAQDRVQALERDLEHASAGAAYVGSQASLDASAAHLGSLEENRGIATAQYVADNANLRSDLGEPGKLAKVIRYEILRNNANFTSTQLAVSKDLAQYTTTRAGTTPIYPGIAGFQDKVTKEFAAVDDLRQEALTGADAYSPSQAGNVVQTARDQAAVDGDKAKIAAYDAQISSLKEQLIRPALSTKSLGALRAERDAAEAQLSQLSLALSTAQASSAQAASVGEVVIVDRATEAKPTLLRPAFLLPLGLLVALILAIGAAYLAELLSPRLYGARDVEAVYGKPILATLRSR